jgi:hypothetical protein
MTGNETLDLIIGLAFWAGLAWMGWDGWRRRKHARQISKQRAEAIARGEWGDQAPDIWIAKKFPWLANAAAAWLAYRESFVFREEMRGWPKVRHLGPGHFLILAPHAAPRRMQQYGGWKPPVITGAVFGGCLFLRWGAGGAPGEIFFGAFFGFMSIPFWHWMQRTRLKIEIADGAIAWRGPDRRPYAFKADQWRELEVLVPHRLAREEERLHGNFMRAYPNGQRPEPLFQISSELVMQVGLRGSVYAPVAEFYDDLSEEKATRLQAAINHVWDHAMEEADAERLA